MQGGYDLLAENCCYFKGVEHFMAECQEFLMQIGGLFLDCLMFVGVLSDNAKYVDSVFYLAVHSINLIDGKNIVSMTLRYLWHQGETKKTSLY